MKNNRLKSTLAAIAAAATTALIATSHAEDRPLIVGGKYIGNTSLGLAYQYWNLGEEYKYNHQTHPDDKFLSGSPGSTSVSHSSALKLDLELSRREGIFEPYVGAGPMIFIGNKDRHKNDNDPRPDPTAAFVYSKVFPLAGQVNLGSRIFPIKDSGFNFGGGVSGTFLAIDHGWDRFGRDESAKMEGKFHANIGGTIGFKTKEFGNIELGYFKGINNKSSYFSASYKYEF